MTQYDSILLRQNLDDKGLIPRTGGWTACPDIIPAGISPIPNPTAVFTSDESYATNPDNPLVKHASNYIYLRGKNLSVNEVTATARIFYARQSLFLYPQQWINNPLKTSQGSDTSEIKNLAAGAIGVTTDPFAFIPTETDEHHCLVGFLSTPEYPFEKQKPPNSVTSMQDLAAWIAKNGGTGWHNVNFAPAGAPTFTNTTTYSPSSTDDTVQITISWNGVPIGSEVSFSCGTPLPDGTYISLPKTKVSKSYDTGTFVVKKIPKGWTSEITYSYWAAGDPLPNFEISMSASIVTNDIPSLNKYGKLALEVFPNHKLYSLETGMFNDNAPMPRNYLIPVGSVTTKLTPNGSQ